MKRSYLIGAVVVVVVIAAFFVWQRTREEEVVEDLVVLFSDDARVEKRSAMQRELAYRLGDQTIAGETKPAIFMHPTSRLTYRRVTIPEDARLRVYLAVKEEAWDKASDGVLFRFGIGDGREYEELLTQHVDPVNNQSDRRWIPQDIDLSAYAGQQVDLIFNTNTSLPGRGDNGAYDFAVWGTPLIVVRQ